LFGTVILMPVFKVQRGFTLIELLIVMAIIGILSTIILANYNNFGARQEVKNAAAELKSNLRKYQTFALASQKNPDPNATAPDTCYDSTDPSAHPLDYYRIQISTTSYNVSLRCDSETTEVNLVDDLQWPTSVSIEEVGADGVVCAGSIEIRFRSLSDQPLLSNSCGAPVTNNVYIRISNVSGSATRTVTVTNVGEIREN